MTHAQLVALLSDLIRRRVITEAESVSVLAAFDDDELDALTLLPAAPEQDGTDWLAALALLLLLINGNARRRLPPRHRTRARTLLRGQFDTATRTLAQQVATGALPVAAWHGGLQAALANYTRQMAAAGAGQLPNAATRAAVDAQLETQWPYMNRFAATIVIRQEVGRPLSAAYIANRARQYGGTAWGSFFQAQGEAATPGMVEQWVTRDDPAVCRLCRPRHLQYYLPGQGPMPGDCLGVCRCTRTPIFAPEIYAELTGRGARAA